jgi:membrane-bound lytic murein transglycosylase D
MKLKSLITTLFCFVFINNLHSNVNDSLFLKDIYFQRLNKTDSKIPIFYNEQVRIAINQLIKNTNNATSILLGKAEYYTQKHALIFEQNDLPKQLFLMAASNSQCNSSFVDNDGASGIWGISYAIAKKYNLNTNSYIDERRDIVKSTIAASEYINDLNLIYKDWLKTLVAFRIGPINMNMAIHKSDKSLNYAKIHKNLSPEHQMVATNFMAFWYIWNFRNEHKIQITKFKLPDFDTVHVYQEISLNSISFHLNTPLETLKTLNPELRLDIMPVAHNNRGLKLPIEKIKSFKENHTILFPNLYKQNTDSLHTDSLDLEANPRKIVSKHFDNNSSQDNSQSKTTTITYTVKKGDGLLLIADIFDCKVADIKKWNGIKKDNIFSGQKLKIKVPENKLSYYKKINSMSLSQKRNLAKKR